MNKNVLISVFIWLLVVMLYNQQVITGYVNANVNLVVLKPFNLVFFDANNNPIDINTTFYYSGTDIKYESYNVRGNKTIKTNRDVYDIELFAYANNISVFFREANFTNINKTNIGVDKINAGIGDIITYAVNKTFPVKNATLNLSYENLAYTNESALNVLACHDWNFLQRKCNTEFIIINSTQDTANKRFTFTVNNLSAFAIKEEIGVAEVVEKLPELPTVYPGIPRIPLPKIPKLPEIKPLYLPEINVFLEYPPLRISLSLLLAYTALFIVIYLISTIIHKIFFKKQAT